jgi:hypothetical protein
VKSRPRLRKKYVLMACPITPRRALELPSDDDGMDVSDLMVKSGRSSRTRATAKAKAVGERVNTPTPKKGFKSPAAEIWNIKACWVEALSLPPFQLVGRLDKAVEKKFSR